MYTFKENAFFANTGVGRRRAYHFPASYMIPQVNKVTEMKAEKLKIEKEWKEGRKESKRKIIKKSQL